MTYRDFIKQLESDGWFVDRQAGSHIQYRHAIKPGTVAVQAGGKLSRDIPPGTHNKFSSKPDKN